MAKLLAGGIEGKSPSEATAAFVAELVSSGMTFPIRRYLSAVACAIAIAFTTGLAAAQVIPQDLSFDSKGRAVAVTLYEAEGNASRPAVLVLHGSSGFEVNPQVYRSFALALAKNGIDAYLVRYFSPSSTWPCACWDTWAETVADVTTAVLQRPEASGRIGLLGFSLGGAVAVTAARDPRITALAVFYGFIPNDEQRARIDRLPPLLVLHGDADGTVPLSSGKKLVNFARQLGGRAELVVYPGAGHGYSTWGEPAATSATNRTIAFFRTELIRR